jgi:hypothetical protein
VSASRIVLTFVCMLAINRLCVPLWAVLSGLMVVNTQTVLGTVRMASSKGATGDVSM